MSSILPNLSRRRSTSGPKYQDVEEADGVDTGKAASLKDEPEGMNNGAVEKSFLPQSKVLTVVVVVALLFMPFFTVMLYTFIHQVLFMSIAFVVYSLSMVSLAIRVRYRPLKSKAQRTLLWLYILASTALIATGIIFILKPLIWKQDSMDIVVMGGLTTNSVKLSTFSRVPEEDRFYVHARAKGTYGWKLVAEPTPLDRPLTLGSLIQDTKYEYRVVFLSGKGEKETQRDGPQGTFKTLPESRTAKVKFASSSCQMKNRVPGGVVLEAYDRILKAAGEDLDFMMFLGDFVYVDVPFGIGYSGIGFGNDRELYDREYRGTLIDPYVNNFYRKVPAFFQFDDHEWFNDASRDQDTGNVYNTSVSSWSRYLGNVNPLAPATSQGAQFFLSEAGSGHFFFTDTRSVRNVTEGTILGTDQYAALTSWLLDMQARFPKEFKFILSTPGVSHNEPDETANWNCRCPRCAEMTAENEASCPNELDRVLKFIADNGIEGVLFVSGDTHKPGVYELAPGVIEFSASPIHGIGDVIFPPGPDKVLFDQTNLLEVFNIFELEGSKLTIKLYGGGYHPTAVMAAYCTVTLLVMWVSAVVVLRKDEEENKIPRLLRDNRFVVVVVGLLVGILMICGINYFPVFVDPDFDRPLFQYTYDLLENK